MAGRPKGANLTLTPLLFSPDWVIESRGQKRKDLGVPVLWRLETFLPLGHNFLGLLLLLSVSEGLPCACWEVTRVACCRYPGSPGEWKRWAAKLLEQPRKEVALNFTLS